MVELREATEANAASILDVHREAIRRVELSTGASLNAVPFYERRVYVTGETIDVSMAQETVEFTKMRKRFE